MKEDFESPSQQPAERVEAPTNAQTEAVGGLDGYNAARDAMKGADTATVPPLELYDSQAGTDSSGSKSAQKSQADGSSSGDNLGVGNGTERSQSGGDANGGKGADSQVAPNDGKSATDSAPRDQNPASIDSSAGTQSDGKPSSDSQAAGNDGKSATDSAPVDPNNKGIEASSDTENKGVGKEGNESGKNSPDSDKSGKDEIKSQIDGSTADKFGGGENTKDPSSNKSVEAMSKNPVNDLDDMTTTAPGGDPSMGDFSPPQGESNVNPGAGDGGTNKGDSGSKPPVNENGKPNGDAKNPGAYESDKDPGDSKGDIKSQDGAPDKNGSQISPSQSLPLGPSNTPASTGGSVSQRPQW